MSLDQLKKFADSDNIAVDIDEQELREIGMRCLHSFEDDQSSQSEWQSNVKKVLDLAGLVGGPKNYPLPNSANVKFPLIIKACYEFSSRVYPEIVKDNKIVKARVIGKDPYLITDPQSKAALALRVCAYMNYQLLEKNEEWELSFDRLLNMLALIGFMCTKTYYDPIKRDVICELCDHEDLIIHSDVKSLSDAIRVNHIRHLRMNELITGARSGIFLEEPVTELLERTTENDKDKLYDVIEQHGYLDLDDDDYQEPYVITFLKDTGKILRIKARYEMDKADDSSDYKNIEVRKGKIVCIKPVQHFTDFHFLVNPKGKFHSVGFGTLMFGLNNAVNTLLNELIDSGNLANLQGGFIDERFKPVQTGNALVRPGEFIKLKAEGIGMKLSDGVMPFTYKEPSDVLFKLMGTLIESGEKLSASSDIMTGGSSPENSKTGATQALLQEGQKVHTAILKRIYRGLTDVFSKVFHFDGQYIDPHVYQEISDGELNVSQSDFDDTKIRILPVADPNLGSEAQKAAKLQLLAGLMQLDGVNKQAIVKRIVMSQDIENPEELLAPDQKPQPDPAMLKVQAEMEHNLATSHLKMQELQNDSKKTQIDGLVAQSTIILNRAKALQAVAMADQAKSQAQTDQYDIQLKAVQAQLDHVMGIAELDQTDRHHQDEMSQDQGQHKDNLDIAQQGADTDADAQDQQDESGDVGGESNQ